MANTIIEVPIGIVGLSSAMLKLFALAGDTLLNTGGDTLTERTNATGVYTCTVTENITGVNRANVYNSGGALVYMGRTEPALADDTGTYQVLENVNPTPAALTAAGNIKADLDTIKTQSVTCGASVTVLASVGTAATSTAQTGDGYAIVSSGTHGNAALKTLIDTLDNFVDTEVAAIVLAVADIQTRLPNSLQGGRMDCYLEAAGLQADAVTEIQTALSVALASIHLDHLLAVAADGTECVNSTYMARLVSKSATPAFSSYTNMTDSLEALRDRGDAAWTTATGFSTHSAADVWAVATRVLTAGTNIALAKGTGVTGFNDLSASDVRAAVGLASANLDMQLGDLPTNAELATALGTADDATLAAISSLSTVVSTTGVAIATATQQAIADQVLIRGASNVEDTANEHSLCGVILAMLESSRSGTTWTVRKTGGTTFATKTLSVDATAVPVVGVT